MYDHLEVEKKWHKYWDEHETFKTDVWDFSKPKFYALDMFPYPSGVGLHAGHPEGYTATDIVSRMKRMQGYNVLHPMGYDSFGLPAEQYAVQTGNNPNGFTQENIKTFTNQLKELGFDYDWSKMIATSDPDFYHWTQWIFKQLYKDGYAKYVDMPVNWCEELGTVLSNDEVIDGKSERGGYPVIRKNMKQLCIDQAAFAERLLEGLNEIDWPESTKEMQRHWIGRSTGVEVQFEIVGGGKFSIFTTCIETIYGITFMVLAPDGDLVQELMPRIKNQDEVKAYIQETVSKSEMDRRELNKGKSGCRLEDIKAINPVNGKEVEVFIGDFVLANYGTGAVMAVPSHDQRDFEYAIAHNIDMIQVIEGQDVSEHAFEKQDYLGKGCKLINSEEFTGLTVEEAKVAITKKLVDMGIAKETVNYRFREWIFARQRYWGEPIPIVHCTDCGAVPVPEEELPFTLPEVEKYEPTGTGESPLADIEDWVNCKCPVCGKDAKRETNTMPQWAGSSWYFLRYIDNKNNEELVSREKADKYLPVDMYIGGVEHAVLHLLYSRFYTKFLCDIGVIDFDEPFHKLFNQGMITGKNGIKMSKSKGNVVSPDDLVRDYGCDSLRMYELFVGPPELDAEWDESGIDGVHRFLTRFYKLIMDQKDKGVEADKELLKVRHKLIYDITTRLNNFSLNTVVSGFMEYTNTLTAMAKKSGVDKETLETAIVLLAPFAPHIAEELWEAMGHEDSVFAQTWPTYDEEAMKEDEVEIVVQINGKVKGKLVIGAEEDKDSVLAKAKEVLGDKLNGNIVKEIYVPGRIVNIVQK